MSTMLVVDDVRKHFGGVRAVDGVSFQVARGEIRAIIGPNGAGKTTLFNILSGRYRPDTGTIHLEGRRVDGLPPSELVRAGVGRSFQITNIFPGLSVVDNVVAAIAATRYHWTMFRPYRSMTSLQEEAFEYLRQVGLADKANYVASALSHGEQRHLEIALTLATRPRLLLLDEPTAGMAASESRRTMDLIESLVAAHNLTVVFTEHDMNVVFSVAHRITVMHRGRVMAEGPPEDIRRDERVIAAYLGDEA